MKIIKEHIEFQKGGNPYKSMKIGSHAAPRVGDRFVMNTNMIWNWEIDGWDWGHNKRHASIKKYEKFNIIKVEFGSVNIDGSVYVLFDDKTPQDFELDFFVEHMGKLWIRYVKNQ